MVVDSSAANPTLNIFGPVSCGSDTGGEPITVDAPGSTGYQYDPGSNSWQFNWKTTGLQQGCYNIFVTNGQTGQTAGGFPIQLKP
jgi:hypothetical protein